MPFAGETDFLVVGAGIAGASCAYELAAHGTVIVLEREEVAGYHATGRSAATFSETYGNYAVRALTVASRSFLAHPPTGFAAQPILRARPTLLFGRADQRDTLETQARRLSELVPSVRAIGRDEVLARVPILRPDYVAGGVLEPDASAIDVAVLHEGYLRAVRKRAGRIVTGAEALAVGFVDGRWQVETPQGTFAAPILVNAAGAWADEIGHRAGLRGIGLSPRRRTALIVEPHTGAAVGDWPQAIDVDEAFYFLPDAGRVLLTPADETPSPPCDAQPEEIDVAVAIDRFERATTWTVGRVVRRWAGLRSFVADRTPVAGFAADGPGFFWLAAQGGYGIQTAPAMARLSSALARGAPFPDDLLSLGIAAHNLAPGRAAIGAADQP